MFKNLNRCAVTASSTTELEMPELGRNATLILAPAFDANPTFQNAFLKLTAKVRRADLRDVDAERLDEIRDIQRELYGRYIIKGWSGVEGEEGGEGVGEDGMVPFTRDNARKLARALPNHLFDKLTIKAAEPSSFYAADELPPSGDELDELSGNS